MATALNCGAGRTAGGLHLLERVDRGPTVAKWYGAVSMQLAVYPDSHHVELHILTDHGESIAVACPGDSILALQRHIEQISRQCPEIAGWSPTIVLSADGR